MLTRGSGVFVGITLEMVQTIAEWAGLRWEEAPYTKYAEKPEPQVLLHNYYMWQDRATGGGGCRIVCDENMKVAWVSRHSGYPWANVTEEVEYFFREMGAREVGEHKAWGLRSPQVYGYHESQDSIKKTLG